MVEVQDVRRAQELFADVKESAKYLREYEESFLK